MSPSIVNIIKLDELEIDEGKIWEKKFLYFVKILRRFFDYGFDNLISFIELKNWEIRNAYKKLFMNFQLCI